MPNGPQSRQSCDQGTLIDDAPSWNYTPDPKPIAINGRKRKYESLSNEESGTLLGESEGRGKRLRRVLHYNESIEEVDMQTLRQPVQVTPPPTTNILNGEYEIREEPPSSLFRE